MANQNEKIILELLKIEGNSECADCGKRGKLKVINSDLKIWAFFVRD